MFRTMRSRLQSAWRARTFNRRNFQALDELDDRMLSDIGLCRADLRALQTRFEALPQTMETASDVS
ncbi:DUF1127 domain-containing protein [Breoghania sp. L-A4]|uniref:DUF1127 domain-containing protein n=1 Tax=Breoghania sp. L-A4 TaxID=2304600 RepID=UPI0013C2DA6E|nr:DUF1127 domain-containing protein [Breoghania sp. L-A4]